MWLDFVNTDLISGTGSRLVRRGRADVLDDIATFLGWLQGVGAIDAERVASIARRAEQQPTGAAAALADARRVRVALCGV